MDSPAKVELMVQGLLNDPNTTNETKKLVAELLSDTGMKQKKQSKWFAYLDLSYSQTQETNVDAISKTGKQWIQNEEIEYVPDSLRSDKSYNSGSSLTVGKNLDNSSTFMINLGGTFNKQDKSSSDENTITSSSASYFKILGKHYLAPYVYYSRPNYKYAKDSNTKGMGFNNTYIIDDKKNMNYGLSYSVLHNDENHKYTTANETNNHTYSSNVRYNYNLSKKSQLSGKLTYSVIDSNHDPAAYDSTGILLSYAHVLPFGTLRLQSSYTENTYREKETNTHTTLNRKDEPFVNSISLRGQLNQIMPFAKKINKDNSIFYSLNFKHSDVSSTLMNYDTERQFFTVGLSKRINFNFNK